MHRVSREAQGNQRKHCHGYGLQRLVKNSGGEGNAATEFCGGPLGRGDEVHLPGNCEHDRGKTMTKLQGTIFTKGTYVGLSQKKDISSCEDRKKWAGFGNGRYKEEKRFVRSWGKVGESGKNVNWRQKNLFPG